MQMNNTKGAFQEKGFDAEIKNKFMKPLTAWCNINYRTVRRLGQDDRRELTDKALN
jgi:hypothetical protein